MLGFKKHLSHFFRKPLSLDCALEQGGAELLLKEQENNDGGRHQQERPGVEQDDIGAVFGLERLQRACHGSFVRIVDQDQGQQEGVPGGEEHQQSERRDGRLGQRKVDVQEGLPGAGAVDARRFAQLRRCGDEVRVHPEHREGHVQPDQREDQAQLAVQQPQFADLLVQRHDRDLLGKREGQQEQKEEDPAQRNPQDGDRVGGHGGDQQGDRHHAEDNQNARSEQDGDVRDVPRIDEVVPLGIRGQLRPCGILPCGARAAVSILIRGTIEKIAAATMSMMPGSLPRSCKAFARLVRGEPESVRAAVLDSERWVTVMIHGPGRVAAMAR